MEAEAKRVGGWWSVRAFADQLAAGHERLRKAIKAVVEEVLKRWGEFGDLLDKSVVEEWAVKFEKGMPTWRGRRFAVGLKAARCE